MSLRMWADVIGERLYHRGRQSRWTNLLNGTEHRSSGTPTCKTRPDYMQCQILCSFPIRRLHLPLSLVHALSIAWLFHQHPRDDGKSCRPQSFLP